MAYMTEEAFKTPELAILETLAKENAEGIEYLAEAIVKQDSKIESAKLEERMKKALKYQRSLLDSIQEGKKNIFFAHCGTEYEVSENPRFRQAFDLAWEMGHSNGYSEVENYFSQLVQLIK